MDQQSKDMSMKLYMRLVVAESVPLDHPRARNPFKWSGSWARGWWEIGGDRSLHKQIIKWRN